jgi:Ala-tRNA(Pro) deacylase
VTAFAPARFGKSVVRTDARAEAVCHAGSRQPSEVITVSVPMLDHACLRVLEERSIPHELLLHPPTMRAADEAAALGLPGDQVGKTVVVRTPAGFVRSVVQASDRISLEKLRELIGGGRETRLATEEELAGAYPMFELGAVPPFAGPAGDRVLVDRALAGHDTVVIEGGSHAQSIRLRAADLLAVAEAEVLDIRED